MTNIEKFYEDYSHHIDAVRINLEIFRDILEYRGLKHDESKKKDIIEKAFYIENGFYSESELHNSKNRHHIEFHENGIRDMNLLDLVEMFCNIISKENLDDKEFIINIFDEMKTKYNISDDLISILKNTLNEF